MTSFFRRGCAGVLALIFLAAAGALQAQTPSAPGASLLDRLPRVSQGDYATALAQARARGSAGAADAAWIELFYGPPAAKAEAERALAAAPGRNTPNSPEWYFLQFVSANLQGQDRQMLGAALRLAEAAPDDVATELAVRALSGQFEREGRTFLDAVPSLQRLLQRPLRDPATVYMLGRSLLAAVHAPGMALTENEAMPLAGRIAAWQLWGPFGKWQNLNFDRTFPIEKASAAAYVDGTHTRHPQPFTSPDGEVQFPVDWGVNGVDFAVTYVHVNAQTPVLLRFYSSASAVVEVDGVTVLRNDRRSTYTAATGAAAFSLAPGWSRVVIKLAGESNRAFDVMMRPAAGGTANGWSSAAAPPSGAGMAQAPRLLPAPLTLATWSRARLAGHPQDVVALWVDGIQRTQDDDGENAVVELSRAAAEAPNAAPVWVALAQAYGQLDDASQSWAAAQVATAAQHALNVDPKALRAYDRLGHVYESQGKFSDAAQQYAHCSGRGFADCDWSDFHLAVSQSWTPEAETALGHALAVSGSYWTGIASGLDFYDSVGNAAKVAEWERVLGADPRAAGVYGDYELSHGAPQRAAELLQEAIALAPSDADLRRDYLQALLLSGRHSDAEAAAQQALADFPNDWRIASAAADIDLSLSPSQGLAALRSHDYNRDQMRYQADFLANDKFWQPWYHSAADVIKDSPGKTEYPNANAVQVLDQMVDRINPDSSQDQYIHEIYRVLNSAGISELGTVDIPSGSELITLRTIKQSGAVLLPEDVSNLQSVSMPGLEPGDFIDEEYVQHMPPSGIIPGIIDNNQFFVFNSSVQTSDGTFNYPDHYSDYIVLSPKNYPLMVDQARFPGSPTVTQMPDGDTAREWLVQKAHLLTTEPHMPPQANLVPKVWVSSQLSWKDISQYLADHLFDVRRYTPAMRSEAVKLVAGQDSNQARANAIFNWVAANIQPAQGAMLAPARQAFTDRSGNRISVYLGLLSAAHVPFQLVMSRPVTDNSSTKIPSLYQFQYPLIHVPDGSAAATPAGAPSPAAGWYDLNNDFARLGYIVPGIRGGLALEASAAGDGSFLHVPSFFSPLDGVGLKVTGTVADDGDANLHLDIIFRGPNGEQVRQALSDQPASSLPQVYQQMVLANYPNANASGGKIENMNDHSKPLIISIDATVPNFVHLNGTGAGSGWDIEHLVGSVGILSQYAPLPFRTWPLVISGDSIESASVNISLPARFGQAALPPSADLHNQFGSFTATFAQTDGHLTMTRELDLNPNLIPPGQYQGFRAFAQAVDNQDRLRVTGTLTQ